jgi:phosphoglucosamine mutase
MRSLFGTDGIRGRAYEPPLDEDTVRRLGAALAADLSAVQTPPRVLLAGDTRASTVDLASWIASSIQAGGGHIVWGGVLPTPAVSQLCRENDFSAGIVISASHNPADDNGIKILGPNGEKLADDLERHLEQRIETSEPLVGPDLPEIDRALGRRYVDLLLATHTVSAPLAGLHVVVDAANGAASGIAQDYLSRLGARVTAIASSPDGNNINDACGATAPDHLARQVVALEADAGIALDGDADRVVLVDEKGAVLDGDDILLAWARHLRSEDKLPAGRVVATVMSNFGLERALTDEGMEIIRCDVGDRWVWQTMNEHGSVLGGEQSGHIICSHYGVTGDGLLTGSHLLAIAWASGRPVSALSNLHRLPQILVNVPVTRMRPFDDLPGVSGRLAETHRLLARRGRVLLRYSGTEALARVMIEGEDAAEIEALADGLAEAIRNELG